MHLSLPAGVSDPGAGPDTIPAVRQAAIEDALKRVYSRTFDVLRPGDFSCTWDGPFKSTIEYAGLSLPSLHFGHNQRQTAYALLAISDFIEEGAPAQVIVTLAWVPRVTAPSTFDVYLSSPRDGNKAEPEATVIDTVTAPGSAGEWVTSTVTMPSPPVKPCCPMVLTLSRESGSPVDLLTVHVSLQETTT